MSNFSTPAIMLRRMDFGDYDLIITFFTLNKGKVSAIAKSAKKSSKRFSGILELFSVLDVVCNTGRRKGLPVLQEATLKEPFSGIRTDIKKTAYASYWSELINKWMENGEKQTQLYYLFQYTLGELSSGHTSGEALSILFQMKFMAIAGLCPSLKYCGVCKIGIDELRQIKIAFDLINGSLVCNRCASGYSKKIYLSKGTIKQLLWIESMEPAKAARIRFAPQALKESLEFLELFVPYHLGKKPKSLKFLRQIRR